MKMKQKFNGTLKANVFIVRKVFSSLNSKPILDADSCLVYQGYIFRSFYGGSGVKVSMAACGAAGPGSIPGYRHCVHHH